LLNIINVLGMDGACSRHQRKEKYVKILIRKLEGTRIEFIYIPLILHRPKPRTYNMP
jgi:hypothetical protein